MIIFIITRGKIVHNMVTPLPRASHLPPVQSLISPDPQISSDFLPRFPNSHLSISSRTLISQKIADVSVSSNIPLFFLSLVHANFFMGLFLLFAKPKRSKLVFESYEKIFNTINIIKVAQDNLQLFANVCINAN